MQMHLPSFSSPHRSPLRHRMQVNILLIFLIGGLATVSHVETIAAAATIATANETATDCSNDSLSNENGFSVELPKPLLLLANGKQSSADPVEPVMSATLTPMAKRQQRAYSHRPTLMDVALQASAREGLAAMNELYSKIVPDIIRKGHVLEDNHPAALLSKFSEPVSDSIEQEMAAYATISATKAFRKNYKYFNDLARQAHTSKISLRHTALEGLCPPRDPPTCMPASARYRTHDGTCNSRRRPRWGAAQMPFNRFLPPEYGDGVDSIRLSVEGVPLASSRFVSLLVHGARDGEAAVTLMTAQWGQLLDHDMTSTAQPRSINGSVPSCCGNTDFHPSCFPIKVPLDDPWLAPLKVRCLEFLRSAPAQRRDCILSWREQTNQATSYIDASPIYSNSVKSSDNARVFRNGLLVYGRGNPAEDVCQRGAIATQCIRSGDGRSGEQPGLLALHHVWVGEHNRIAMELSEMNLHWSDEKIYQETRRIIGAMFQHITYREFLPIVVGREVCKLFDLELLSNGYYQGYDPKTNPTVANSFAAAAFRFGHSLVQNTYMRCDRFHNFMRNNVSLHEEFQRGDIGSPGSLHRLIRGLVNQRALKRDEFITPELTNHLFQTPGFPFGLDLAAINIQRGRDHGVPPYTSWRVPCGLTPINNWDDFANVVGPQSAQRISHAYRSVHDIDLFVGGIAERPVVGGLVGPTFACIIAQQFSNSRKGDRFWYEIGDLENTFTPAQLQSIRRVSLAQVLCRAVGGGTMQPHVFLPTHIEGNERQVCGTGALSPLDLSPWNEQDPFATTPTATTHEPVRVFNVIATDKISEIDSTQVLKENKVGFPTRGRPTDHKSPAAGNNGFAPGAQVPGEIIRINDKLDIRQKFKQTKRPTVTAKPIKGINNKLDKNLPKIRHNVRGAAKRKPQGISHTPVEVNNIPIELRSASEDENVSNTRASNSNISKIEARVDDTDQEDGLLFNDVPSTENEGEPLEDTKFSQTFYEVSTTNIPTYPTEMQPTNKPIRTEDESSSTKEDITESATELHSKIIVDDEDEAFLTNYENTTKFTFTKKNSTLLDEESRSYIDTKLANRQVIPSLTSSNANEQITANTDANAIHLTEILLTKRGNETPGETTITSITETENAELTTYDKNKTTVEISLLPKVIENKRTTSARIPCETNIDSDVAQTLFQLYSPEELTAKADVDATQLNEGLPTSEKATIAETTIASTIVTQDVNFTTYENTNAKTQYDTDIDNGTGQPDSTHKNVEEITNTNSFYSPKQLTAKTDPNAKNLNEELLTERENETTAETTMAFTKETENDKLTNNDNNKTTIENSLLPKVMENEQTTSALTPYGTDIDNETANTDPAHINNADIPNINPLFSISDDQRLVASIHSLRQSQQTDEKMRSKRRKHDDRRKLIVVKVPNLNIDTKSRLRPTKAADIRKSTTVTPSTNLTTRLTSRQVELRQYQTQPTFYTRPQKVVVNGPNADQYEIEINIRQTNKQSSPAVPLVATTNSYANYATSFYPFGYDKYVSNYLGTHYSSTVPPHAFYSNTPASSSNIIPTRRTKPPTVIYINEHEDRFTTTARPPGLFQNLLSYASTGFGNSNKPKQPSPHSTSIQKERPNYGASLSGVHDVNQIFAPNTDSSAISHYIPRPATQTAQPSHPAAPATTSLSQVGSVVSSGVVQATSSAVSAGNFGTISGVAQANGADSTFSFNIRPKPNIVAQPQLPFPPNQIEGGSYGIQPSRNPPTYSQLSNLGFSATGTNGYTHIGNSHKESANSPFSSENKRPQQGTYGYYSQLQNLSLQKKSNLEHILTVNDYDEFALSRTLEPIVTNKNATNKMNNAHNTGTERGDDSVEDDDYDYGDDDLGMNEKFDQDGYIRPEHIINALIKSKENELKNLTAIKNCTINPLDDNYVLPVLSTTEKFPRTDNALKTFEQGTDLNTTTRESMTTTATVTENVTNFPDVEGKHLSNEILAEDYADEMTDTVVVSKLTVFKTLTNEKPLTKTTEIENTNLESVHASIAFAPIQILTKLERPDNWVIYDSPKNYPLLPESPVMNEDSSAPADEVPMPLKGLASIWLEKVEKQKDRNKEQFMLSNPSTPSRTTIQGQVHEALNSKVFTKFTPVHALPV